MELNRIYNCDVIEGIRQIPDSSIDLIITSPPYNLGKVHHTGGNRFNSYNDYSDELPEEDYQQWQIQIINECYRVLSDEGSMFYNHKNRIKQGIQITPYQWLLRTKPIIKQEIIWFNGSQNFDKCRFYPMTERIYWLSKSKQTQFYNNINHHDLFNSSEWKPEGINKEHKRAFPVMLAQSIICCFPDAKIVMNPFMGSGTTAIAAIKEKKSFIGFEIDKKYCEIANKRIQNEKMNQSLF